MAAKASPEASEIRRRGRQRLIGAIVLVMVLVVVVPMILDSEPRAPRSEPALAIPSKDSAPPLPPPPADKPATAVAPEPRTPAAPQPAPDAKVLSSTPPKVPAPAPDKAAPAKSAPPRLEGFAVQVGAFRDEARLASSREKLAAAGIVHYTERIEAQGGALTRLRAGPFPTREAAEAALARLKRASLEGKVVALP
jgi:DedD protein